MIGREEEEQKEGKRKPISLVEATRFSSKVSKKKKSSVKTGGKGVSGGYTSSVREEALRKEGEQELRLKATQKHLEEMCELKSLTKDPLLPKIWGKQEDKF